VSTNMMANAFEAMIGAVSVDAERDALEAVHQVLERTGFLEHPMLVKWSLFLLLDGCVSS
jgi:ribonuclease-3